MRENKIVKDLIFPHQPSLPLTTSDYATIPLTNRHYPSLHLTIYSPSLTITTPHYSQSHSPSLALTNPHYFFLLNCLHYSSQSLNHHEPTLGIITSHYNPIFRHWYISLTIIFLRGLTITHYLSSPLTISFSLTMVTLHYSSLPLTISLSFSLTTPHHLILPHYPSLSHSPSLPLTISFFLINPSLSHIRVRASEIVSGIEGK